MTASAVNDPKLAQDTKRLVQASGWVMAFAAIAAMIFGANVRTPWMLGAAAGFSLTLCPFALGTFFGFLFGIPKARAEAAPGNGGVRARGNYLIDIADWLTKIVAGITLTQLANLPTELRETSEWFASNLLGGYAHAPAVATVLVFFAIAGFFVGHISTRLVLNLALDQADLASPSRESIATGVEAMNPRVAEKNSAGAPKRIPDKVVRDLERFDMADLEDPKALIALGAVKLQSNDRRGALAAMERAVDQAPEDRQAREAFVLTALYDETPRGFERAIQVAENFFVARPPSVPADARLQAYLACAYGQKYAWDKQHGATADQLLQDGDRAIAAARSAVALDAEWKPTLRAAATAPSGSLDDDLVELARDRPELLTLLG